MLSNYVQDDAPLESANSATADVNMAVNSMNMGVGVGVGVDALSLVQSAVVAQVVQQAAVMMNTSNDTTSTAIAMDMESTIVDEKKDAINDYMDEEEEKEGEFLSETEFALLSHATTTVGDFDPLSENILIDRPNFIPILEARGGTDKDEQGHRRDTLPIAHAIDELKLEADTDTAVGSSSGSTNSTGTRTKTAVFQFMEENDGLSTHAVMSNDALKKYLAKVAHGVIVRINPGTLSAMSQKKCDEMLRELGGAGVRILSHPDVTSSLGAKDSLVKIKNLKCGLEDTEVYYTPESFSLGFRTTIAFQPRVIKQNRGSQGEGIWIVKLKDESAYCSTYGQAVVSLDTELVLMEAFDNHVEYHTVGEFIDFCIYGRLPSTSNSVEWTTTSSGRYFDGGLAAGAMVVDQRFLPRIVEGEVRCLMVGSKLVEIVHKKPAEGGLSATLQSGATYTKFAPNHDKFAKLVKNFKADIPHIMDSFGMADQPLPLLWTADYIYGETDDDLYVGEINCSCVGITQQLSFCPIVAEVAVQAIFGMQ